MSLTPSSSTAYMKLSASDELEKSLLQKAARGVVKPSKKSNYGSLRTESLGGKQSASVFVVNYKHRLSAGETLAGISLKYGVPIENIKRANRLWSNDLAFLKDTLIVPMDREKLKEMNLAYEENGAGVVAAAEDVTLNLDGVTTTTSSSDPVDKAAEYKDYLNKFDSFINESKIKLKNLETNPNLTSIDHLNNKLGKHRGSSGLLEGSRSNGNGYTDDDPDDLFKLGGEYAVISSSKTDSSCMEAATASALPECIIQSPNNKYAGYYSSSNPLISSMSTSSRARLAQENLQRLEREKDDLYEL